MTSLNFWLKLRTWNPSKMTGFYCMKLVGSNVAQAYTKFGFIALKTGVEHLYVYNDVLMKEVVEGGI